MQQPDFQTARDVSEYFLDLTARAILRRDADTVLRCFALPQKFRTAGSTATVSTPEEIVAVMDRMRDHLESIGATRLERNCVAADFRGPDRVEATHVSRLLRGDEDLVPPYPVFTVLERRDGVWRIVSSDYAVDDDSAQGQILLYEEPADPAAMAIYQKHLDDLSDALIRLDFAAFQSRISLPHGITTETEHFVIETEEQMSDIFHGFAARYGERGLTAFVRIAKTARFVGPDEIIGTHESHQMAQATRITRPYPNRVRLVRGADGIWRETHCANAILNTSENFRSWTRVAEKPRLPDLPETPSSGGDATGPTPANPPEHI